MRLKKNCMDGKDERMFLHSVKLEIMHNSFYVPESSGVALEVRRIRGLRFRRGMGP